MRKSKIILEIRKKTKFLKITNKFSIYKLLKDLTKTREKSYQAVRFSYGPPSKFLNIPGLKISVGYQTMTDRNKSLTDLKRLLSDIVSKRKITM